MSKIKLVDAIANLRREIQEANAAASGEPLKLLIQDIEVDFAVEIEQERKGNAELSFSIPIASGSIGGGLGSKNKTLHSVRLKLRPKGDLTVSDDGTRE